MWVCVLRMILLFYYVTAVGMCQAEAEETKSRRIGYYQGPWSYRVGGE